MDAVLLKHVWNVNFPLKMPMQSRCGKQGAQNPSRRVLVHAGLDMPDLPT